jgi:hypothetical protein
MKWKCATIMVVHAAARPHRVVFREAAHDLEEGYQGRPKLLQMLDNAGRYEACP